MRVIFLLTQDLESPSGLGRYLPLAQELVRLGHQVEIAALHSNYQQLITKWQEVNGVEVHYVAPMHVKKKNNEKSYYSPLQLLGVIVWATCALTKAAIQSSADIVQIAKPHPMNGIAGLVAKYLRGKALFVDCDDYEAGSNRFGKRWQQKIVGWFEKRIPKHAKVITTNTQFMRQNLISWGISSDKIVYIPNGIDPDRFSIPPAEHITRICKQLKLENKKVIAYIGSLSLPSHPVDLLLKSFPQVLAQVPNAVLMIVGGGEDFRTLEKLSQELQIYEHTIFIGRVFPQEIPLYYKLADVSVDPVYDDFAARGRAPLKLLESWICGVPFVTSNVGDRKDLLRMANIGSLAIPGDANSLANEISKVLDQQTNTNTVNNDGGEGITHFYWSTLSKRLEEIYKK